MARCVTSAFDTAPDDSRFGFDGNLPGFGATLIGGRKFCRRWM
jgi:hypothetical protein